MSPSNVQFAEKSVLSRSHMPFLNGRFSARYAELEVEPSRTVIHQSRRRPT
jgi:hypothetical protein